MSESSDHAAGDGERAVNDAAEPNTVNLPVVMAPQLSGADDELDGGKTEAREDGEDEAAAPKADEAPAPAAQAQSRRFLVLAATLAFAAAFGSFVGSVSGSGMVQFIYPPRSAPGAENTFQAMQQIKAELAEIGAIKTSLENAARNNTSQYAKIADRLDQLDRRTASAADVTGSLSGAAQPDDSSKFADRILQDWTVDGVQNGRALIESRYGGVYDVGTGSILPGIGRVDAIKRQDGRWVVLTARGTITSAR